MRRALSWNGPRDVVLSQIQQRESQLSEAHTCWVRTVEKARLEPVDHDGNPLIGEQGPVRSADLIEDLRGHAGLGFLFLQRGMLLIAMAY